MSVSQQRLFYQFFAAAVVGFDAPTAVVAADHYYIC